MKSLIRLAAVLCLTLAVHATDGERKGGGKKADGENDIRNIFLSDIPDYPGNVILARPTGH